MDETARLNAFGEALLAAMEPDRYEVDYNLRRGLVDVMQRRPIKPADLPVVPWRTEEERLFRERFGRTLMEASRAHGIEIPSEVAFRLLVWLLWLATMHARRHVPLHDRRP